nr:uncharacterized protein LOC129382860 [Dermacentor andersoni]
MARLTDGFRRQLEEKMGVPSGIRQRLSDAHWQRGCFVDGCSDVFRGQETDDNHEEIGSNRFEGWYNDVLQKLPAGSVIVLGNAPYHTRQEEKLPTAWKKENIEEWLKCTNMVNSERIILRLPPYHCKFNTIKLGWAKVKNRTAADNRDFKLCTVEEVCREKVKHLTAEDWGKNIHHVMDLEPKFMLDTSGSDHIQPIIQLGEDGTEESASDCELSGIEPLDEA